VLLLPLPSPWSWSELYTYCLSLVTIITLPVYYCYGRPKYQLSHTRIWRRITNHLEEKESLHQTHLTGVMVCISLALAMRE
jgi:hypothetical protein